MFNLIVVIVVADVRGLLLLLHPGNDFFRRIENAIGLKMYEKVVSFGLDIDLIKANNLLVQQIFKCESSTWINSIVVQMGAGVESF